MKATRLRVLSAFLLTIVFVLCTTIPAVAAPPQKATVDVYEISDSDSVIYWTFSWADKLKPTHYRLIVTKYPTANPANRENCIDSIFPFSPTWQSPKPMAYSSGYVVPTYSYDVEMVLLVLKKNETFRELKHTYTIDAGKPWGYNATT